MKTLTAFILLSLSGLSFAESAKLNVGAFKGELKIEPSGVKIQSMHLNTRLQFCNFWGTTCAGGPSSRQQAPVSFREDTRTNLLVIKSESDIELKASKVGNRFSSCTVNISLYGVGADGSPFEGNLALVHNNDKDTCGSKQAMSDIIRNALKVPQTIKMWRN